MQATYTLSQAIHYENVTRELQKAIAFLKGHDALQVDCHPLQTCDSSITAFFIELIKEARQQHKKIRFIQLPPQVKKILDLSNLLQFIEE